MSTSYHPQTDGQTERRNQEVEIALRYHMAPSEGSWCSIIPALPNIISTMIPLTEELTIDEKENLSLESIHDICERLIKRFKKENSKALEDLKAKSFSLWDLRNGKGNLIICAGTQPE
ncbi:hypothetical protein F5Y02DRAFT_429482 [Annulohypoxylon stygium]|nr:hypothetical protein F5Y02DRAFT_429482 [Annulohypoxylon stygium]